MELKQKKHRKKYPSMEVLIEPLWNWNVYAFRDVAAAEGINRTFMELKHHPWQLLRRCQRVLIEPLWNWNSDNVNG